MIYRHAHKLLIIKKGLTSSRAFIQFLFEAYNKLLTPAFVLCVQYKYRQCLAPTCIIYECHIRIEGSLADIHHATRSSPERAVNRCNDVTYLFKFNRSKRSCSQFKFFEFYSCYSISVRVEMCFTVLQWIESTLHTRCQKFT